MTVNDVLLLETLKGAQVLTGQKGLSREVREMAVMEVPDVDDYLKPHDFLLTTLYPVCNSEDDQHSLIKRLSALGVSGIGVKLNRYVKKVSEETVKTARKIDFPIIILPEDSNFSHQINDFLKHNLRLQSRELALRAEMTYFNEFVSDLLTRGAEQVRDAHSRACALGFNPRRTISILVLQLNLLPAGFDDRATFYERLRRRLTRDDIMLAHVEQYAVAFIEREDDAAFDGAVSAVLDALKYLKAADFHIGVSHRVSDFRDYSFGYQEAKSAVAVAQWLRHDRIMFSEDIGAYRIIRSCENKEELVKFSDNLLGEVIEYDKKNKTSLFITLRELIERGGNIKETAVAMSVHYNTVRYRTKLLSQLTGKNLQSFNDLSDLSLALKIHIVFC